MGIFFADKRQKGQPAINEEVKEDDDDDDSQGS